MHHHQPSLTIKNHHQPSLTITNHQHHQPSGTIMSYIPSFKHHLLTMINHPLAHHPWPTPPPGTQGPMASQRPPPRRCRSAPPGAMASDPPPRASRRRRAPAATTSPPTEAADARHQSSWNVGIAWNCGNDFGMSDSMGG